MRRRIHPLYLFVVGICWAGVVHAEPPDFSKHIAPLFTKYCTGCHNDADREGKLSLESYASLLQGGDKGAVINPQSGDLSRLILVLTGKVEPKMPPEGEEPPTAEEIALIKAWIDAGAKGPEGQGPDLTLLITPKIPLTAPPRQSVNAIAVGPQGNVVAIARHGEVELKTHPERKLLHKLSGHRGSVNAIAFSDDGQFLVAAAGEPGLFGEARLWKIEDGSLVKVFQGHKDSLYAVQLSPDGSILATGSYDSSIKLWDVASGSETKSLDGHNGAVFELAFRKDGKVLASASGDRTVKLWDVATGERLDTLKESQKELYTLAFHPDGTRLAAAGVDNRIRVWQISESAKEGSNPLLLSKFAHETPVLRLAWSADGKTVVSTGEDRLVKIWNAETMTIREELEKQTDWASGVAILPAGSGIVVGRIDGSVASYPLAASGESELPLTPLPEVPPEVDYGPQPPLDQLPLVTESEPNDEPQEATAISAPGRASGLIHVTQPAQSYDEDLFRIDAQAGEQWIIETNAARAKSPLDTKIEVLDAAGSPVPRLLLRAVRDSVIEFRGMNGDQRGVRLANYEEMLLNEYIYLSGEVIKHYQQRRGPDADSQFYPENGSRWAYFDTTSRAHALGEPAYVVVPYAVGTELPNNGLPVFPVYYENDDESHRKLGKDSRLTFVAPQDGTYLVRVSDVRGFSGENFKYELVVRRPVPDFKVTVNLKDPAIPAGSGKQFTVKAERIDNFSGPIRVDISGMPPGFQVTTPLVIQAGLTEAHGVINALPDAPAPTAENMAQTKLTATATVAGKEATRQAGTFGTVKLEGKPKVIVHLELPDQPVAAGNRESGFPQPLELTIAPGGSVTAKLRVERFGFDDRIPFDVANLPHGIIVDDIGLSGVLVREKETERTISLRAEPWVPEQTRVFFAVGQVEGNQVSCPLVLHVRRQPTIARFDDGPTGPQN